MTNPLACPACGHERKPTDDGPLSACPSCKVVFSVYHRAQASKAGAAKEAQNAAQADAQQAARAHAAAARYLLVCTVCGTPTHRPKTRMKGSPIITLVLLLFWLVPGIIYEIWRKSTAQKVCPTCDAAGTLIPQHTPAGQSLLNKEAQ